VELPLEVPTGAAGNVSVDGPVNLRAVMPADFPPVDFPEDVRADTWRDVPVGASAPRVGKWPSRARMMTYATLLTITEMAVFAFYIAGTHGLIVPLDHQPTTDFVSFYAAGTLANADLPWLAYDHAAHHASEQAAIGIPTEYNYFYYPPVFLLICAPLARLGYLPAFVLLQAVSAVACFCALRMIRRDLPLIVFLAFPGLWWAIGTGQNALLTATLFAAGTALLECRPWLAGLCLGALCYKPDVGLLIPVALIAGGHWRAFLGATGAVLVLAGASLALFGAATWEAFLAALATSGNVYAGHAIFMGGLTSPFGALMTLGAERGTAGVVQVVATVLAATSVAVVWRPGRRAELPVRAAVLLAATPVAVPVLMFYDLMLVLVALIWISRVPSTDGSTWLTAASVAVFLGPILSGNLAANSHWLVAFISASMAFGLALAVAWRTPVSPLLPPGRAVTGAP
jgi:alpha-1,2-mannosyltransferase